MVSRGGRSKGCTNCRRRRVKCDETRPICNRCQKRGLYDCDGPKAHTFIIQTGTPNGHNAQIVGPVCERPADSLCLAAFEDDICVAFTRKLLLNGAPLELACDLASRSRPTLNDDPSLDLLRDSITSLSATFFGSQHHQNVIEKRGYRQYGRVLAQLNKNLGSPDVPITDSTILTALICLILEVFLPTGPDSFLKHMQGIDIMLAARGVPSSSIPSTTLALVQGLRILSIVGGLHMGKPSLYSKEEWKQIPCFQPGAQGRLRHDIFSVLADCTRFMAERDALLESGNDPAARHVFLTQVRATTLQLDAIHSRWQALNLEHMKTATSHFGEKRKIADTGIAIDYLLYNAAVIILLDIRETVEPVLDYISLRNEAANTIVDCLQKRAWKHEESDGEFRTIRFIATKVAVQVVGETYTPTGRRLVQMAEEATLHNHCKLTDIPIQARSFPAHDLVARKAALAHAVDGFTGSAIATDGKGEKVVWS